MTSITEETDNALSHQSGQSVLMLSVHGLSRTCTAAPTDLGWTRPQASQINET